MPEADILDEFAGQIEFNKGVEFYNSGYYFEAHDAFEEVWMDARGNDKVFLQAFVQLATGTYHLSMQNFQGGKSQLSKCLTKLSAFSPQYRIFNIIEILNEIEILVKKIPQESDKAFSFLEINPYIPTLQKIENTKC